MPPQTTVHQGLRIAFAGTPDFAAIHLRALLASASDTGHQVVAVYTQPDRPAGRGKKLAASPVKTLAQEYDIPVFQPQTLRTREAQREFAALNVDIFIVVAYGLLIPQEVLDTPKYGCINVHASLLPRWRGAAPIQRAIEAGDRETGITIMQMDIGLDTGDMLNRVRCPIDPEETGGSLHDKLAALGAPAMLKTLADIASGTLKAEKQDNSQSCYAHKISKEEAAIDWSLSAQIIGRKVRAFNPFPVTFTQLNGQPLRIWSARVADQSTPASPGTLIRCDGNGVEIACGEGSLIITQAQLAGKKPMAVGDIIRGNPKLFSVGLQLGGNRE
jgi:methionyl-tRNA formyltransferase